MALIGLVLQLGFVAAYALSGVLTDYVFTPLLVAGRLFAHSVRKISSMGSGSGMGLLIIVAGILLCVTLIILYNLKLVKNPENRGDLCITG